MEIKTKFNIDDEIFFIFNNKIVSSVITGYEIKEGIKHYNGGFNKIRKTIVYYTKLGEINETDAFYSREDVLESL